MNRHPVVTDVGRHRRSPRSFGWEVWLTAGGVVALLLAVSGRYGFHRDELYFIVAGRNLDWGFVDQPPLTPLAARLSETIGGTSPTAIRVLPALAIGVVVLLAASMARRFGGGRRAQFFAGITAGATGYALGVGHLLSTSTFDYLLWTVAIWLLCRLLDGADPRQWAVLGAVVGIGLQNKHLIGLFAVAVLISLLATPQRRLLAGPWPWVGVGIATFIAAPNLIWQAANEFPQLEMAGSLADRSDGPAVFILEQIGLLSIVLAIPAVIGWWRLMRSADLARWRSIGLTFALLFAFFLLTGGKSYYTAPMYPVLLAAGALWFEGLRPTAGKVMAVVTSLGLFVGLFVALPLLPASSGIDVTGELGETVGWPELVEQVATIYESIPEGQQSATVIYTASYGEAGAIDVLGAGWDLPAATSAHNNYWLWGPPQSHGPVIGVGRIGDAVSSICPRVERVGQIGNPYGVENEEAGAPLVLCLSPSRQLADVWEELKHYN